MKIIVSRSSTFKSKIKHLHTLSPLNLHSNSVFPSCINDKMCWRCISRHRETQCTSVSHNICNLDVLSLCTCRTAVSHSLCKEKVQTLLTIQRGMWGHTKVTHYYHKEFNILLLSHWEFLKNMLSYKISGIFLSA